MHRPALIFPSVDSVLFKIGGFEVSLSKTIVKKILSKNHCLISFYNSLRASQLNIVSILPENIINISKKRYFSSHFFVLGLMYSGMNFKERQNV
jgi:hypothetical protein